MKTAWLITLCYLFSPIKSLAQLPPAAGRGSGVQVSLGYTYFDLDVRSSNRVILSGPEASLTWNFLPHFGAKIDVGYARASNVFGGGHQADVLTHLAGPVFYPARHRHVSTYIQGLLGAARVTGVVPANGGPLTGYAYRPSWALGGGGEYRVSTSFSLRVGADYVHTAFFNSSGVIRGQENLRIGFSVVYSVWGRPRR